MGFAWLRLAARPLPRPCGRLLALEVRVALLGHRLVALRHVVGDEHRRGARGLEAERFGETLLGAVVDRALDPLHGQRGVLRDLVGQAADVLLELFLRDDLLHDADAERRLRVDPAPGEREEPRPAGADLADQAQVAAGVERDADARLGQAEARVVGRDAQVAHHRDLEPGAEATAVDRHDHGLREVREDVEALVDPPEALVVVPHLLGRRAAGDAVLGHAEVDAGAEGAPLGPHDHDAHAGREADLVGPGPELARGLPAPGVELVGAREDDRRDRAVDLESDVLLALAHRGPPRRDRDPAPRAGVRAGRVPCPSAGGSGRTRAGAWRGAASWRRRRRACGR